MTKNANKAVALLFTLFLAGMLLLNLVTPDREFSDSENRYLQTLPAFSPRALFRGEFTQKTENYCADQFVWRDTWISLKARLELLQGKKENNGVFLCADERLIEPLNAPEQAALDRQIASVNTLAENAGIPVTLGLIPTSAELYAEFLPAGVENASQRELIEYIYANSSAETADILSVLASHADEYVFYRTDHHWTSLGAYYGYCALSTPLQLDAVDFDSFTIRTVTEDFSGTAYSSSGFFWVGPDSMQTFVDAPVGLSVERYEADTPESGTLYAPEMLSTKDKYRFYLGGNIPRCVIRTGNESLPSLLLLRDSYADSLSPFLLEHYSDIHLIDLRYYRGSVSDYIRDNGIDTVLVLYSLDSFCTDSSLALMTR